jgi:CBS domain containing-hemolysin-like protein
MAELITVGIIALLIAVNGLFVAAEFAIIGTPRAGLLTRAARGDRRARRLASVVADPIRQDRFIATAQLGITLASLGLGMYGEHTLATWIVKGFARAGWAEWAAAHALASGLSIAILTYFHIVLGEMVPKSLALSNAESTALAVATPMRWVQRAMMPLVLALNGVGNGLLRLVGVDRRADADRFYTPEELEGIVTESQQQGQLDELPGLLVRELFDFFELTAEQVMVPRVLVVGVPLGARPEELSAVVAREPHTRYPVFEGDLDHVVGFVHVKDLARQALAGEAVGRDLVRPAALVPGSFSLDRAIEAMRAAGAQLAVVLDEHGGTAGILTVEDLFEELVGELEEEAQASPEIRRLEDGSLVVEGTARLEEIGEALGIEIVHEDVETVSGLVLDLLGRPPVAGDAVVYGDLELTVATVAGRGVGTCRVHRRPLAVTPD